MATNDEIIAKLPLALVELRKQNKDAATKAAEDRAKEFEVATAARDALEKGSDERKAMNSELAKMRNQDSRLAARAKEAAASTAGQAVALKEELEKNGKIAEDNKEFQKLSYQARKEDYAQRLADATSPAAKKEIREEARADAKKNGSRLDKIAAGIGGLFEMGKKGLKAAKLGGLAILSTLAIGAFVIALGKFLQSDTFKKMTKFISEVIIPKLMEFWGFIKDNWEVIAIAIGSLLIAVGIVKAAILVTKFIAIAGKIAAGFSAVVTFLSSTMLPAITAFMVPLLPFIAIAAAVALVLYALWEAFQDFRKTLEETGSIGEAIKVAIGKFVGVLLGAIPALFLKLVAFVADLFGFKEFAEKIGDIDPIQFIADSVTSLIDSVVDFFKMLFNFDFSGFAKSLLPDVVKKAFGISGETVTPEDAKAKRIAELEKERSEIGTAKDMKFGRHKAAERGAAMDAEIAKLKSEATAGLAKPMVLPKAKMSESETLEAQRLSPSQYKQSGSIQEKMEKSKQQAELARQQSATAGPTNIVDARQSSSVTTTGHSGNSSLTHNKFVNLNLAGSGLDM